MSIRDTLLGYVDLTDQMESGDAQSSAPSMPAETVQIAVVIPAYRPEGALLDLIAALSEKTIPAIVVVDDGSGPDYREIFRRAVAFPKVCLVRHAVNLGKGAALKTGFNYALCSFPSLQGVVTADADGQHHPEDILQVLDALAAQPDHVVLGTRTFGGDVPLRSLVGNVVTRSVMRALVGQRVSDTQTGLRGIPSSFLPHLLRTEANGYDFELDMLIGVRQQGIRVAEVPIRTIYEAGNRTSHFNPLIDSMKIYFVLLRFSSVSLMTAALDLLVFYLAYRRFGNLAMSQALGRLLAVAFNYSMVRRAVFSSKARHAAVLPKYLLLVCLSGTASYAGIQLLNARFHWRPLGAKLLVESFLFLANFAIQRDFIFGKRREGVARKWSVPAWADRALSRVLPPVLMVAAAALSYVVWYGIRAGHLLPQAGWTKIGIQRLEHYTWMYCAVSLVLAMAAPRVFGVAAAVLGVVAMVGGIGPVAVLSVVLFLLASWAIGLRVLGGADDSAIGQTCAVLVGICVYVFAMTFLARLPVNYPAVYVILMAAPLLLDWRGVGRRLAGIWRSLRAAQRENAHPRRQAVALALLIFVLGMHLLIVPQPEAGSDALAMHLAIPVNISLHHAFTYRPDRILWSVMPMGADWCYSMVYLLGGEYAARLLNFALLLLVELGLYLAVRRWVSPAVGYVIAALFASTSMVQLVTGSLMVENLLAAVIAGMVLALWRFSESGERRFLYGAAILGGTALAVKVGGLAFVAAALPVAAVEIQRQWRRLGARPVLVCGAALMLLLAAALPAYLISWKLTRDPLFPFLNKQFPSPILDRSVVVADYRFNQPLTYRTPYNLMFDSSKYYEGRPGSVGFQYLILVPLGLIGLITARNRFAFIAAFISGVGAVVVLKLLPNARYLYPAMPLLLIPLAALFGWLRPGWVRRALIVLTVGVVLLNTWFLPSSNFYHGDFYERSPLSAAMRQAYIHKSAPMREIGQYMNRAHAGAPVFLAEGSEISAFNAEAYTYGWHQYNAWAKLQTARSPQQVLDIFDGWNVHYVAAPKPGTGVSVNPPALQNLLAQCSVPEFQAARLYLARLESKCSNEAPREREPLLVQTGYYDDFDPAIAFRGRWSQHTGFPQTSGHTITYSNLPGSQILFTFEGNSFTYVYTKASNRGKAEVVVDGERKAVIDMYSAQTKWQTRKDFWDLGKRRHTVVITALADANPEATDRFIDVDAFQVE